MPKSSLSPNKVFVPFDERPRCQHRRCNEPCQLTGVYRVDGTPQFRKWCSKHHSSMVAKKHGKKSLAEVVAAKAGFDTVAEYSYAITEKRAKKLGYDSAIDYLNSKHPYRKYRKDYCENRDGRLGYKCRYKIRHTAQLQVDHINGNPSDNRLQNLQTLCSNCHIYKTHVNKDYLTPGRASLKKTGLFSKLLG